MRKTAPALVATVVLCATPCAQEYYFHPLSAAPGDTVNVHVSSGAQEFVTVGRTRYFGDYTDLLRSPNFTPGIGPIVPGSYGVTPSTQALEITDQLSLEAWIKPVTSGGWHGILTKYSTPGEQAYMIYLMPNDHLSLWLSVDGFGSAANRTETSRPIPVNQWTHVVATYDGRHKRVYLDGQLDAEQPWTGPIFNTTEPIRVGAYGEGGAHRQIFDGHIDSPVVYNRALSASEIRQRFLERADYSVSQPGVLAGAVAQWNFDELVGERAADATGNGHDLTLFNHPTRGVEGPSPRLGPNGSHSFRFHGSDLYNPDWPVSFSFTVPGSWSSGLYYVRNRLVRQPLIIKPMPGDERRIAVLASTNTWSAYNNWSNSLYSKLPGLPNSHYYVGTRQPNPGSRLDVHTPGNGGHLVDAERYLYKWLDDNGYPFDLYSDLDLHKDPDLLDPYDVLMISGHSEYWTTDMMDHVASFQDQGGSVVNLSGNTMWSRVTFNEDYTVMEGRKYPPIGSFIPPSERWHSQEGGVLGGLLRCVGRPEHDIVCTGYAIGNGGANGWVEVQQPGHWVFAGTGVDLGTPFGQTGLNNGMMFSYEVDEVQPAWTPAGTQVLATGVYVNPTSHVDIVNCQTRVVTTISEGGDVIYYDHPGGGGVFGIPAVTAGGSLMVDPVMSQVLRNVLDGFLGPRAACVLRNGTGVNPVGYSCVNRPIVGEQWQGAIATTPNTLSTAVLFAAARGQLPFHNSELLVSLVPPPVVSQAFGVHAVAIPLNNALLGASLATQGARVEAPGSLVLLNAQDLTIGR